MDDLARSWRRATSCEVCWVDGAGRPAALTAVPLLDGGVPCVALPYSHQGLRPSLDAAVEVAFTVTDSRSLPLGDDGFAVFGRLSVTDDLSGDVFAGDLLTEELVKYPPSRVLADSPLLCRENWWWLPRILLRLTGAQRMERLPPRGDATREALLVREDGAAGLRLDMVTADDWSAMEIVLAPASGTPLRGDGAPALVHGHDHTPDRERWDSWSRRGPLRGDRLTVLDRSGDPGLDPAPPRLLERLRRQRALERDCRRGIAAAERGT